jgi:hypothetical protein
MARNKRMGRFKIALPFLVAVVGHPTCNWQFYLDLHTDVQKSLEGFAPSVQLEKAKEHYEKHGKKEGRQCYPPYNYTRDTNSKPGSCVCGHTLTLDFVVLQVTAWQSGGPFPPLQVGWVNSLGESRLQQIRLHV